MIDLCLGDSEICRMQIFSGTSAAIFISKLYGNGPHTGHAMLLLQASVGPLLTSCVFRIVAKSGNQIHMGVPPAAALPLALGTSCLAWQALSLCLATGLYWGSPAGRSYALEEIAKGPFGCRVHCLGDFQTTHKKPCCFC